MYIDKDGDYIEKQVYRRRYESRRSWKPKVHLKNQKNKIWRKTIVNMTDRFITSCNVARSWHWFRQVTAPCNVSCGSGIMTVNSPSGSILQCDTWLWDDMPVNSPGGSTLQCSRWLWDDTPWNSPKRPPYWNSTSILTILPQSTCHSAPVCEILPKSDHPQQ